LLISFVYSYVFYSIEYPGAKSVYRVLELGSLRVTFLSTLGRHRKDKMKSGAGQAAPLETEK
jgi:hypothetical protein